MINRMLNLAAVANTVANSTGVKVTLSGLSAYTSYDTKPPTINIPYLIHDDPELVTKLIGYLGHEAGHIRFTLPPSSFPDLSHELHAVFNILEDCRIEYRISELFRGLKQKLSHLQTIIFDSTWVKQAKTSPPETHLELDLLIYVRHLPYAVLNPTHIQLFDRVLYRDWFKMATCEETFDLARKIVQSKESQAQAQAQGQDQDSSNQGQDQDDSVSSQDQGQDQDQDQDDQCQDSKSLTDFSAMLRDQIMDAQDKHFDLGSHIGEMQVDTKTNLGFINDEEQNKGLCLTASLDTRLRALLQARDLVRKSHKSMGTQIDTHRLTRPARQDFRIFKARTIKQVSNAQIITLIDKSGSMTGLRDEIAMASSYALRTSLDKLKRFNVRHSEYLFTDDDFIPLPQSPSKRFNLSPSGGTGTGQAVSLAIQRMDLSDPNENKIILILTDGETSSDDMPIWESAISLAKSLNIKVLCVAIESYTISKYYEPRYFRYCENLNDIPKAIFELLESNI